MLKNRRLLAGMLALPALLAWAAPASAQTYPAKAIRWLVPYPAGGGSDFLARTVGQQLSTQIGQPVLIDNKPGGNTAIAAVETGRAAPDGYTILSADNGTMVFNPALYSKLTYNPSKDLLPVTLMGKFPMILVVSPGADFKDAKDFVAKAKAKPGAMSFGSAGAGSPHHLAMELLKVDAGLFMTHIPYRGAAPALTDLAGGQIPAMMVDLPPVAPSSRPARCAPGRGQCQASAAAARCADLRRTGLQERRGVCPGGHRRPRRHACGCGGFAAKAGGRSHQPACGQAKADRLRHRARGQHAGPVCGPDPHRDGPLAQADQGAAHHPGLNPAPGKTPWRLLVCSGPGAIVPLPLQLKTHQFNSIPESFMLSRRHFLGAGLAAPALYAAGSFVPVWAQNAPNFGTPTLPNPGFRRMKVGDVEVVALVDGITRRPLGGSS